MIYKYNKITKLFSVNLLPFNTIKLCKLRSFNKMHAYAKSKLGSPIGIGTSRSTYLYKDNVIKIANSELGVQQNKVEFQTAVRLAESEFSKYLCTVIDADPNGLYLVQEKLHRVIQYDGGSDDNDPPRFNPNDTKLFETQLGVKSFDELIKLYDQISSKSHKPTTFNRLIRRLYSWGLDLGDLTKFGTVIRNNKEYLVLYDLGLNNHILNSLYKGK